MPHGGSRKGAGRPAGSGKARSRRVQIRLSDSEYAALQRVADLIGTGTTPSVTLRVLLHAKCEQLGVPCES